MLPHSLLGSVRNIVAVWKSCSPSIDKSLHVSAVDTILGEVAIKLEPMKAKHSQLEHEYRALLVVSGSLSCSGWH